jgi:hypothetical protein
VACNNSAFGDPAAGVRKWCETRPLPTPQPGWTFCAWENTRCAFTGTMEVHYGANGTFTSARTFTGGVDCNNSIFGDPLVGLVKWCETRPVTTTTTTTAAPTTMAAPSSTVSLPFNTNPPAISGISLVGKTVKTSDGTWLGSPTSFSYVWSRCDMNGLNCIRITGATSSSYLIAAPDQGRTLIATVIASNAAGSTFANSTPTSIIQA